MYRYWPLNRRLKLRYFIFAFILLIVTFYLLRFYTSLQEDESRIHKLSSVNLKHVVVHLDLKGAPPQLQYLERLLPLFVRLGVSGILIEYEDMFPYEGRLVNLSSRYHYDRSELKIFLNKVNQYQIEVIPLIQTMGHLEQVLKLREFVHLREVPMYPDSICPSNDESIELIKQMLEQVIVFHSNIAPLKHIHIGCDEVHQIKKCQKCREKKITKGDMFDNHVRKVRKVIFNINAHINVLIWDDMFREIIRYRWNNESIIEHNNIEPVYRDFRPKLDVSHFDLFQYHNIFKNIWIASAFKGADGRQATLPNFKARLKNHHSWMTLILDYVFTGEQKTFNFKGIILTGWSRYSHMDPLCELLPPSVPSLILNILLIQKYRIGIKETDAVLDLNEFFTKYVASNSYRELQCHHQFNYFKDFAMNAELCSFEGAVLYNLSRQYKIMKEKINADLYDEQFGLSVIDYYSKLRIINLNNLNKTRSICKTHLLDMYKWKIKTTTEMSKFYNDFVTKEYVQYKLYTLKKKVRNILFMLEDFEKTRIFENNIGNDRP